jgi:formiminotetrahydrofolate cyclodeaminase
MELSEDKPSPGGGAAAAAAGAMGASLLVMVCGLTRKKQKFEANWTELSEVQAELAGLRDSLIILAAKDAESYDSVLEAIRRRKTDSSEEAAMAYDASVREATEVPRRTAAASLRVLELATKVAALGSRSASSDTGVGIRLAEVGVRGAAMNILINLKDSADPSYVRLVGEELMSRGEKASELMNQALEILNRS